MHFEEGEDEVRRLDALGSWRVAFALRVVTRSEDRELFFGFWFWCEDLWICGLICRE